ncbi:MAG: protein kinase [Deltaproteobacteria bacterium]|nr:protein kinase [Deltaproteobacteria bacterium]
MQPKSRAKLPASAQERWRIGEPLGDSGQSSCWRVTSITDGTRGVLKVPFPNGANKPQLARLQREMEILSQRAHSAIVALLDYSTDDAQPWLVTPEGIPLNEWWLARREATSADLYLEASEVVTTLARGLIELHDDGIIHRDIKPENVVILRDGEHARAVLIDFGVAYIQDEDRLTKLDGRSVRNDFATPPAAFYGPIEEPGAWWDCLGLAWLWAWMLAEHIPRRHLPFSWKHHRLLKHPHSENLRALVAACSNEDTGPRNANELLQLARRLRLTPTSESGARQEPDFTEAQNTVASGLAQQIIATQTRTEALASAAALLNHLYSELIADMIETAANSGLPIELAPPWSIIPRTPPMTPLTHPNVSQLTLIEFTGRRAIGDFTIRLSAWYQQGSVGTLPVVTAITTEGCGGTAAHFTHRTDGALLTHPQCAPMDDNGIHRVFVEIMQNPSTWSPAIH